MSFVVLCRLRRSTRSCDIFISTYLSSINNYILLQTTVDSFNMALNFSLTLLMYRLSVLNFSRTLLMYRLSALNFSRTLLMYRLSALNCSRTLLMYRLSALNFSRTLLMYRLSASNFSRTLLMYPLSDKWIIHWVSLKGIPNQWTSYLFQRPLFAIVIVQWIPLIGQPFLVIGITTYCAG